MTLRQLECLWALALCGVATLGWRLLQSAAARPEDDRTTDRPWRQP
ncbi:hypothetical protein BX265_3694 [Streptomyces sp. TLI_235]|nr:hypothetical protein [Streptomyces sp. TLI_235]PBC78903.1 hypothetical protein BX265_3694 [Streptomyces sp. TLI_235]